MIEKFLKNLSYLLLLCFLIASCQNELENESFINLDDEYELFVTQELSSNGGLPALNVKTLDELECSNYTIPYLLELTPNDIKLLLSKVTLEGTCISQPSYINQNLNFGLQENERNINILFQDIVSNSGKLKVTENEISLNLTSNDGIKISKAKINRIEKNMMWGYIQNGTNSSVNKIKDLLDNVNNGKEIKQGDYGLFYIGNSNDLQFYESANDNLISIALFSDINFDLLNSEIQNIKESDPSLVLNMTLFDGQTINVQ